MSKRVTVPDNSTALVLTNELFNDVIRLCTIVRSGRRWTGQEKNIIQSICGNLLLAAIDSSPDELITKLDKEISDE